MPEERALGNLAQILGSSEIAPDFVGPLADWRFAAARNNRR
jgi:hypothetical protein